MEKKNSTKEKDIENSTVEQKKTRHSSKSSLRDQKRLPWWVELLFVQIGLPDKWLVKILKAKKNSREFIKNERKIIFSVALFLLALSYFQPVVKYSRGKLECQKIAKNYILKIKNIDKRNIKMLQVNLCNGGIEIDRFQNSTSKN